jgi:UDP-N-acetylmuramate--alanine ligase
MLAYILSQSNTKCNAFLGGISSNFGTNYLLNKAAEYTVIEADEFDRSFLKLHPFASIITACDPDHLDIYGTSENFIDGFNQYANLTSQEGFVVVKKGLPLTIDKKHFTYSISDASADYFGTNLKYEAGSFTMDIHHEDIKFLNVKLGLPGTHNAENALACFVMCVNLGLSEEEIRNGLQEFKGVKRRFEYKIKSDKLVFIDDYAHHPMEINALIDSIQLLYPNRKITGIFQPHLFSRTNDFMSGFASSLGRLDELILMPIYPAREEPMEGVTSEVLLHQCNLTNKRILSADEIVNYLKNVDLEILVTIGAGDIDRIVEPLKQALL